MMLNLEEVEMNLNYVRDHTLKIFEEEYFRCSHAFSQKQIDQFMVELFYNYRSYTFFSERNVRNLTNIVDTNQAVRDLILNLTDRVNILLSSESGIKVKKSVIDQIVSGVSKEKFNASNLIDEKVQSQLAVDKGYVEEILHYNSWFLYLFVLYTFFPDTKLFKTIYERTGIQTLGDSN